MSDIPKKTPMITVIVGKNRIYLMVVILLIVVVQMSEISEAAKHYREIGIITHPLTPPTAGGKSAGKQPILREWSQLKEHPTDDQINNFYNLNQYNIGAVCGKNSDLVVLDIDWFLPGMWQHILEGVDLSQWVKQYRTNGRWHWLFKFDESVQLAHEKPLGFDMLANGGNVVMAPSVHQSGDVYKIEGDVENRPNIPAEVIKNINGYVGVYRELTKTLSKCRRTFVNFFNAVFVDGKHELYHRTDVFRGADGRARSLALFAELKANGADDKQLILLCIMIFGEHYDYDMSIKSIDAINPKATALTDTIKADVILSQFYEKGDGIEDEYRRYFSPKTLNNGDVVVSLKLANIAEGVTKRLNVVSFNKQLYVYQNGHYVPGEVHVKAEIQDIAKTVNYTGALKRPTEEIIHYMTFESPYFEYPFNQYTDMVPVNNGIVRINFEEQCCELLPHDPKYMFTYCYPVNYNPENDGSTIHKEVISKYVENGTKDLLYQIPAQAILQALGSAPFKKAYIIQGDPHAGKSSYLELLNRVFGTEYISAESLQALCERQFSIANLEGMMVNAYDDLSDIPMKDTGVFKTLTGKHDHMIERKREQGYKGFIHAVHVFTCNSPPTVDKGVQRDTAFWERWEYIHMPYRFDLDAYFYDRVFTPENISGFFSRVLQAAIQIRAHGLLTKSTAGEVRERWSFNSDPIYQFIDENIELGNGSMYIEKDKLTDVIVMWARANDVDMEKIPSSSKAWTQALDKYEIFPHRVKPLNGVQVQAYGVPGVWRPDSKYQVQRIIQKMEQGKL